MCVFVNIVLPKKSQFAIPNPEPINEKGEKNISNNIVAQWQYLKRSYKTFKIQNSYHEFPISNLELSQNFVWQKNAATNRISWYLAMKFITKTYITFVSW